MPATTRLPAVILLVAGTVAVLAACRADPGSRSARATNSPSGAGPAQIAASTGAPAQFAGSASCRECHERFYRLWAPSWHGLAMRVFTPELIEPQVNLALALSAAGRPADAENSLRRALQIDPASAAANFNLGLLLGELGRKDEAKQVLRRALDADPGLAAAAYNLAVLSAGDDIKEAIRYCRLAAGLRPEEPRYAYTLAFYLRQDGDASGAAAALRDLIRRHPGFEDAYGLLVAIERETGR